MKTSLVTLPLVLAATVLAACVSRPTWRGDEGAAYEILNQSTLALMDIDRRALDGPFGSAVRQACALFVFAGATTGVRASSSASDSGVLLARDPQGGRWNGPAFYRLRVVDADAQRHVQGRVWIITVGCESLPRLIATDHSPDGAEHAHDDAAMGEDMRVWTSTPRGLPAASPERVRLRPLPVVALAYYQAPASLEAILVDGSVRNGASAEIQSAVARFAD